MKKQSWLKVKVSRIKFARPPSGSASWSSSASATVTLTFDDATGPRTFTVEMGENTGVDKFLMLESDFWSGGELKCF